MYKSGKIESVSGRIARLNTVASRPTQRGHFTTAQAAQCRVSYKTLVGLEKCGVIRRVHRGLYRFEVGVKPTWKDLLAGELLLTDGIACGRTAAALYGWINVDCAAASGRKFEIMASRGSRHATSPRHTTRDLQRWEQVIVDGLPVLHPLRTLTDAAHRLPKRSATAMIESAIANKTVDLHDLERRARELLHPKRPGCAVVLGVLGRIHPELVATRNEWERWVLRRAQELGLPEPAVEFEVVISGRRYLLDAAWPAAEIALEFDGRDPHMRRGVHDNDTLRRNDFESAGWRRFGITATALREGDDSAFAHVARALCAHSKAA